MPRRLTTLPTSTTPRGFAAAPTESSFVYAICQPGAEDRLKAEVRALEPSWKLAFSRPGFVTFKLPSPARADIEIGAAFARAWGLSFGKDLPRIEGTATIASLEPPENGELLIDEIAIDGEPSWFGAHVHGGTHSRYPGGAPPVTLDPNAPSRAYLKIEEAIRYFDLPVAPGQRAIELGSAPGGASFALLSRGLSVIGVDPGDMAESVLAHERFQHLKVPAGALKKGDLPRDVDWVIADMNLAPPVSLRYVARVVGPLKKRLRGAILTLKMNDDRSVAEIPKHLEQVASFGFADVRAVQLPSNASEICVVGLMAASRRGSR